MPIHARYIDSIVEAMSIRFNNRVYEMKRQGVDVTVLSLGEAFFDLPLYRFDDLPSPEIFHYSHSRGIPELRQLLSAYYREHAGVEIDPATEILITAGSKIAIYMALKAILDPGDEVIIHEPAWVSYPEQVRLCHGVPVLVPHDVPVTALDRFVTPRCKAVVVNSPHNPRGWVFGAEDLAALHALAARHDLFLISDEAYSEFVIEPDRFVSAAVGDPDKKHTIVCNSMSKNYGMSGWRIGYVITNPDLMYQILKINQHVLTCPATILEYYLVRHFADILAVTRPQIRALTENRRRIAALMDKVGLRHLPGSSTFYFFVSIAPSRLGSVDFCTRLLDERHVSVVPGIGYGASCDRFVRVSIGTESDERLTRGLLAMRALIEETSG